MSILFETDRLILREFVTADAKELFNLNANPVVLKFTGDLPFETITAAREFVENYNHYHLHGFGRWAVIKKESMRFIGWCGLKMHDEGFVDIGFRFQQAEWGKGFATEAALATLQYAFNHLNIPVIIGRTGTENIASIGVLQKLNMTFWKKESCNGIPNARIYRITKSDFFRDENRSNFQG